MSADFDRWAFGYEDSPLQPIFHAAHEAAIIQADRLCWWPRRILDMGCGTGRLLRSASVRFPAATLVGLDPSHRMLLAADHSSRLALVQARAERLPFAEGSFDLVTATSSYRHWSDPHSALREVRRVLAPVGWFVLADAFTAGRRPFRTGRPTVPPAAVLAAIAEADLAVAEIEVIPGYGPIPSITVLAAHPRRHPQDTSGESEAVLTTAVADSGAWARYLAEAMVSELTTPTRLR
jgi:ubiquinone/menaquinone biosynthesis C-methylase UbiE